MDTVFFIVCKIYFLLAIKDTRLLYNQLKITLLLESSLLIYMIVANLYAMQNVERG